MSLINDYLSKTQKEAPAAGGVISDVPPILKSGRKKRTTHFRFGNIALLIVVPLLAVGVFLKMDSSEKDDRAEQGKPVAAVKQPRKRPGQNPVQAAVTNGKSRDADKAIPVIVDSKRFFTPDANAAKQNADSGNGKPETGTFEAEDAKMTASGTITEENIEAKPAVRSALPKRSRKLAAVRSEASRPAAGSSRGIPAKRATAPRPESPPPGRLDMESPGHSGLHIAETTTDSLQRDVEKEYRIALASQQLGNFRSAEKGYRAVLALDPDHIEALTNLSAIMIRKRRFSEAEPVLGRLLSVDPDNAKALVNLGNIMLQSGDAAKAKAYFNRALQRDPDELTALVNLAYLASREDARTEAEGFYERILAIAPENADVLMAYAALLEKQERYAEAIDKYRKALLVDSVKRNTNLAGRITERVRLLSAYARK